MKHFSLIVVFLMMIMASFSQKSLPQGSAAKEKSNVRFFPNPASTTITFEFNDLVEKGFSLHVYSFLGRQVLIVPVTGQRISVNVLDLIKGIYVFQVRDINGRIVATNKFQVSR